MVKIHNFILKAITTIAAVAFLLGACALDSDSKLPAIVCLISLMWIFVFCLANGYISFYERGDGDVE